MSFRPAMVLSTIFNFQCAFFTLETGSWTMRIDKVKLIYYRSQLWEAETTFIQAYF